MGKCDATSDANISFNEGEWNKWILSQSSLFHADALQKISDGLRIEFRDGHKPGRFMPLFRPEDAISPLLTPAP